MGESNTPVTQALEPVEVTQAARDAAADLLALDLGEPLSPADKFQLEGIRSGIDDGNDGVQAFARFERDTVARHRLTTTGPDVGREASDVETILAMPVPLDGHWDTEEGRDIASECVTQPRGRIAYGDMPDLALANAVFMVDRYDLALIHYQTAAKERIRWLSAQLALAKHRLAALAHPAQARDEMLPRLDDGLIEAAMLAHYGKWSAKLGINGMDLTADDTNWTFRDGFERMWAGVRKELERRAALSSDKGEER